MRWGSPRPVLSSLAEKFVRKASMRVDCTHQGLMDLVARHTGDELFQKFTKIRLFNQFFAVEMFKYKHCLPLTEV